MTNEDRDLCIDLHNQSIGKIAKCLEALVDRVAKLEERMGPEINFEQIFDDMDNLDAD